MGLICPVDLFADFTDGFAYMQLFSNGRLILVDEFLVLQLWTYCFFGGNHSTKVARTLQKVYIVYKVRPGESQQHKQPAEGCYKQAHL